MKNQVFPNLDTLKTAVLDQVKILEKDPEVVESFFRKKEIGFITS